MRRIPIHVQVPPDLRAELEQVAVEENRSISNLVESTLRQAMANRQPARELPGLALK
jgi:CopG-like RHH_1 or ribbon-helix-helix domain, RHH_5